MIPIALLVLIYLFLLMLVFVLQWLPLHWEIDFPSNSQRDVPFHHVAYDYSHADWDGLCDHLRNFHASAAAGEFCEQVQVGIDVYIPHRKY